MCRTCPHLQPWLSARAVVPVLAAALLAGCGGAPGGTDERTKTQARANGQSGEAAGASIGDEPDGGWASLLPSEGTCPGSTEPDASPRELRDAANCLVNEVRAAHGVDRLSPSSQLRDSARGKVDDIVRCEAFAHTACDRPTQHWFQQAGFSDGCRRWGTGENLGIGEGRLGSPRSVVESWLESTGHRRNLLAERWSLHDIAVRRESSWAGTVGGEQRSFDDVNVWVSHFGYRSGC